MKYPKQKTVFAFLMLVLFIQIVHAASKKLSTSDEPPVSHTNITNEQKERLAKEAKGIIQSFAGQLKKELSN